ncbi:MAG: response regulator transcription factor [Bacteroidales bacterium]|nr:response regulator transcription factor [Bacteroidales bacterium]MDD3911575.1 response regulator transcription factor [Bacteroidales bacterium]MDD4420215.1 response regulator transcription factor [Bacteroidales bacterium]
MAVDKLKILVVDDEATLCQGIKFNLEVEGYDVDTAYSAEEVLKKPVTELVQYSLILLDVMMGEMNGFKMAQLLKSRPETAKIPIIFCTAKDTEDDQVAGLNIGADDYIPKPFTIRTLLARVKSVLRRTSTNTDIHNDILDYESIHINLNNKTCTVDGKELELTKKEFEILVLLLENKNKVLSRDEILSKIWGDDVIVVNRTIDVTITRLRKKIEPYGKCIVTRYGYGYIFEEPIQ